MKQVVAMAPYERPWSNIELIKDCGLIPYLLFKNHNCKSYMVGAQGGNYPYQKLVQGVELIGLADGSEGTKLDYIRNKAQNIDLLLIRGCYSSNFRIAVEYKNVNPKGKIYLGLDANSEWMDRIIWDAPQFMEFMSCCDLIGTSCTTMADFLSRKWPWKVHCFPNGYYDFYKDENLYTKFEEKENTILSVARLGSWQKATGVMLNVFALVADRLPQWKFKLIGNMDESFKQYVKLFFEKFPLLESRIIFVGAISDRRRLQEEYEKAKVFILSSRVEGGAPNVIGEALHAGCTVVTTKIDAYKDMIDGGNCGRAADIDDVTELAEQLVEECLGSELGSRSVYAREYANQFYNMERIVECIYEQLGL